LIGLLGYACANAFGDADRAAAPASTERRYNFTENPPLASRADGPF
jgi:hypothetical protein